VSCESCSVKEIEEIRQQLVEFWQCRVKKMQFSLAKYSVEAQVT